VILYGRTVEQSIDHHHVATFRKEVAVTAGVPLALVRKRLVGLDGTHAPVLLVHGFGQNRYAWHLPSRSFSNYLANAGFDVFNVDLRGHGRSRKLGKVRSHGAHSYVEEDLPQAVAEVRALSGNRPVFLIGHSLGGLVSYAAAPSLVGHVAGIVSLGSPYHFTRGSMFLGAVRALNGGLRTLGVPLGNVPLTLKPVGMALRGMNHVLGSRGVYPLPLRAWHEGALEKHVLEEHMDLAFDSASLEDLRNLFDWAWERRFGGARGYAERFERARDLPLFVIAGTNDDLAPPDAVRPAYERSRSLDKTYREYVAGHIDLVVGRDAPRTLWPDVRDWLLAHLPRT
jgi:alpha-beta hydrolase superfamily lysophospholipase